MEGLLYFIKTTFLTHFVSPSSPLKESEGGGEKLKEGIDRVGKLK
jgi:hypothetical protein